VALNRHSTAVDGATANGPVKSLPTVEPKRLFTGNIKCPQDNNAIWYVAGRATSKRFAIACNRDFYGGDLYNVYLTAFVECVEACRGEQKCVAVTWDPDSQRCYLKKEKNTALYHDKFNGE